MLTPLLAETSTLTQASDGLALTMLFLIAFSLGMIFTILIVMARNAGKKPELEIDDRKKKPHRRQKLATRNNHKIGNAKRIGGRSRSSNVKRLRSSPQS